MHKAKDIYEKVLKMEADNTKAIEGLEKLKQGKLINWNNLERFELNKYDFIIRKV